MTRYDKMMDYIRNSTIVREKLGIEALSEVLNYMNNPQEKLKVIHVGGTNGKGSTCAFISQMLEDMGYNVGLYTSPYLEEFNERIQINRNNISDDDLVKSFEKTKIAIDKFVKNGNSPLSEFEIITATAYEYFAEKNVDFVILEVGLGGETDATNTCIPIVSVLTSISLDHVDFLGDNIREIARTKAGIIKNNAPVVVYSQENEVLNIIKSVAKTKKSEIFVTDFEAIKIKKSDYKSQKFDCNILGENFQDIEIKLNGKYQIKNFVTAFTTISILEKYGYLNKIDFDIIKNSALKTKWNGRIEILREYPLSIIDGAHNYDGALSLCEYIKTNLNDKNVLFVFGMLKDKEIEKVVSELIKISNNFILTKPDNPRAELPENIKSVILTKDNSINVDIANNIEEAVKQSQQKALLEDFVVIYAGSLYMIGEVRTLLNKY